MAKTLHGYVGGVYTPTKGVQAYSGGAWKDAKSVQRFTGGAWTSALETTVTIINDGTAAAPHLLAVPVIPSLIQSYEWWYYAPRPLVEGQMVAQELIWQKSASTTISITPAIPAAEKWRVEAIQYDGTRLVSNEITVVVAPTATISVTAPAYCLAAITPNTNNNVIVNPTFTAYVTVAADVKLVKIQLKHSSVSTWTDAGSGWTTKTTGPFSTAAVQFTVEGLWSIRAELTRTDNTVVYSNIAQMTCVKRTVTVAASDTTPNVGANTSLTAALSSTAPAGFVNTPLGWDYKTTADWVDWNSTVTPRVWTPTSTTPVTFRWAETWPDGSKLYSNSLLVSPQAAAVTGTGGSEATLQAVLDQGYTKGLPVTLTGTWTINSRVYIPPGARVTATGATFNSTTASQMFSNAGNGNVHNTTTGAAGWQKGGDFIWDGGKFNAANQSSTAFSLVHCPKFTIQNCTIYNTMAHGIEINSSGGLPNSKGVTAMADSDFTVQILNNIFEGVDGARSGADLDEAIHLDYAWTSTDQAASTAGSGNDGTVCNNVLIKGNTVRRTRAYSYSVAVGHHHSITDNSGGRALPDAPHKNIKVTGNTFSDVRPVSVGNERGAVHFHSGAKMVYIVSNTFLRCTMPVTFEPRSLPGHWSDNAQYYWVTSNTFNACGASGLNYPWVTNVSGGTGGAQWYNFTAYNNTFTGAIPTAHTAYLIFFQDTTTFNISSNKFWGLTGGGGSPVLSAYNGNRILGSPASLPSGSSGMTLDANSWCARADGVGNVEDNS